MPRPSAMVAALLLALCISEAPATERLDRLLAPEEARAYRAVGRLNVAGARFCTATLVSPREIVTAAHCLFHPRTGRAVPVSEMRFVAGFYRGTYAALRAVDAVAFPPDFAFETGEPWVSINRDVALLRLSEPVAPGEAMPFAVGEPGPAEGIAIVGYSHERAFAPSRIEPCLPLGESGRVIALSCRISFGASGAPVIDTAPGRRMRIVAIASAIGRTAGDGHAATFAVRIGTTEIQALRRQFGADASVTD